jgi:arsenate reductase
MNATRIQKDGLKLLFICTHNRCRSILCEAITNHYGNQLLEAYSAGSAPAGEVFPLSILALQAGGIATCGLKSQSWDAFEALEPDIVITVCDSAAQETCPAWFGKASTLHWPLPDPSKMAGNDTEILEAFSRLIDYIANTIQHILNMVNTACSKAEKLKAIRTALESVDSIELGQGALA